VIKLIYIFLILLTNQLGAQVDTTAPSTPIIDSVSVADPNTGFVHISWKPCPETDVKFYHIYRSINALWQEIAKVSAPATYYLDTTSEANLHTELYRIAASDSSGNLSPMTPINKYHNTIYCFPYFDSLNCEYFIRLVWNPYLNWEEGIEKYEIFSSINYSQWILLDSTPENVTEYFHKNITNQTSYCYFVRAYSKNGRTSTSNITCYFTNFPQPPMYIYIKEATTIHNKIQLNIILDKNAKICNYKVLRSTDNINFTEIYKFNACNFTEYSFEDKNIEPDIRYFYKVISVDNCGNVKQVSNIASNIVLKAYNEDFLTNKVYWNDYYQWLNPIDSIYLFCSFFESDEILIYSSDISVNEFVHDLSGIITQGSYFSNKICYRVEQIEKKLNNYNVYGKSSSNTFCVLLEPIIYVPNIFTPNDDNINDVFKPILTFVSPENFKFTIYNRWGEIIFETSDPKEGWNGKIKNKKCKEGVYYYKIQYLLPNGDLNFKYGKFLLFYPNFK